MVNEVRLIDANALNKRFDEREAEDIELYGVHITECFPADEAKEIVDQMPTIDPESLRPKGRCKFCEDLDWMHDVVCYVPHDSGNATDIPVNYCPNCGAKMEG